VHDHGSSSSPILCDDSVGLAAACGHAPGTSPQAMSAVQHETAAEREDRAAAQHAAQQDPAATQTEHRYRSRQRVLGSNENPSMPGRPSATGRALQ
jgi:hypothetical protein